ncbi:VCBS repeat-containing protein [Lewinella sp. 4G2]|uniref:VCBS repeat-containing protein n=1 Tax=Lewinella sp. 4G2 TaxID=1803372 RepID=UPI0007B47C79|nr:VCBS repeat-containing protein [Lewinella sp. 4G2]OAV44530.1 hypothetical protein A3850_008515 [Lewinella sp. 4G2]
MQRVNFNVWTPAILSLGFLFLAGSCNSTSQDLPEGPVEAAPFALLKGEETGLTFNNYPELTTEFNVFNYMYFYNGGGLGAGDFNGDGLIDLYFTSNQGPNQLFLNQGDLKFKDVTEQSGVAGLPGWATGVSVVDINQDGLLDIYVNQVSGYLMLEGQNQLYVCQGVENGIPVYKDEAAAYGLDLRGFGTQAAFFDYDRDGDLDMYQLNHSLHQNGTFGKRAGKLKEFNELAGDKLLRNDGGKFIDVTEAAGIFGSVIGYGLGLSTADINNDGWPDIYVGNDFHENDYLYLNNQDGTFREVLTEMIQHTSRFSMGVDIADLNNDGQREIFSLDMLPEDPTILKASLGEDGFDIFKFKLGFGYNPQFSRNTLQLNNGDGSFSEIGAFAGIEASDWSWGPIFFDFDHDGKRDLFISNGIPRRMNDIDYINFKTNSELKIREATNEIRNDELSFIDKMPEIKLNNKFYRNAGGLKFEDLSDYIPGAAVSYSSSSVAVDLDGDGDLDVVTNNIDDAPFIYRNETNDQKEAGAAAGAWLGIKIKGPTGNRNGVGSTAVVYSGNQRMIYDHFPTRGYQSSAQGPLHVSLGDSDLVDSIKMVWPDGTYVPILLDAVDTYVSVSYVAGGPVFDFGELSPPTSPAPAAAPETAFALQDDTERAGIDFTHVENAFVDFTREPLMPHMASTEGPALAVGDLNGDGREDFFVGSSKRNRSAVYLQRADGTFTEETPDVVLADSIYEDVAAQIVDLDNDGHPDLVVAAGGNEYYAKQEPRTQRIYWNDGQGNFIKYVLPDIFLTAATVVAGDVNGDGLQDLLIPGRVVPRFYGATPDTYLLLNNGDRTFTDATDAWSAELSQAGLVTDAELADLDGDGDLDVAVAAEWQPIAIYYNEGDKFRRQYIGEEKGWWSALAIGDLNRDGKPDILAGNTGLNNKLKPSREYPLEMYLNDFDGNEKPEQVITYYVKGRKIPFASHAELIKQMPKLKKEYLFAQDMAGASVETIFGKAELAAAEKFSINTLASYAYLSNENGNFAAQPLTDQAQFSSIHAFLPVSDGKQMQWLAGGNFLGSTIEMGWYDASFLFGLDFSTESNGTYARLPGKGIGGEIRNLATIQVAGRQHYLVARSGDALKLLGPANSQLEQ